MIAVTIEKKTNHQSECYYFRHRKDFIILIHDDELWRAFVPGPLEIGTPSTNMQTKFDEVIEYLNSGE